MTSTATVLSLTSLLLLFTTATTADAASPPPQPPAPPCPAEIVMLSPCLPYISLPPNQLSSTVSPQCCAAFSSIITSRSGHCLCYLLRDTSMLGFPLNTTRLLSLSPDCDISRHKNTDLKARCSASLRLPPLLSTAGSEIQTNFASNPSGAPTPSRALAPSMNHSPNPADNSPTESEPEDADVPPPTKPSLPLAPATPTNSTATIRALAGLTCFLIAVLHLLPFAV